MEAKRKRRRRLAAATQLPEAAPPSAGPGEKAHGARKERRLALGFFLYLSTVGLFYTFGGMTTETLLLSSLGQTATERVLPWVYIATAAVAILLTLCYDAIQKRAQRLSLVIGLHGFLAFSLLVLRLLLDLNPGRLWPCFLGVVWVESGAQISIMLFYSFAGDFFTTRQARRLFGLVNGGLAVGTLVAGYSAGFIVSTLGTANLLYLAAAFQFAGAGFAKYLASRRIERQAAPKPVGAGERLAPTRELRKNRFLLTILAATVTAFVAFRLIEYLFQANAVRYMQNEALAGFFGRFYGTVGVAQVLFLGLAAGRMMRRAGVVGCLAILPVLLTTSSVGFVLAPGLTAAVAANFIRISLYETLDIPTRQLLFLPLPPRLRLRAQAILTGAVVPLGSGLGGIAMLLLGATGAGMRTLAAVAAACAAAWLAALFLLKPLYRRTLGESLKMGELFSSDLGTLVEARGPEAFLSVLLGSGDPRRLSLALDLVREKVVDLPSETIRGLTTADNEAVAVKAWDLVRQRRNRETLAFFQPGLADPRPSVRAAALSACARHCREHSAEVIERFLQDPDETCRIAAAVALLRYGGFRGALVMHPRMNALSDSSLPADRILGLKIISALKNKTYLQTVFRHFADRSTTVRRQAVKTCGDLEDAQAVLPLTRLLGERAVRYAVFRSLCRMPASAAPALAREAEDPRRPTPERVALVVALGRSAGLAAAETLWRVATGPTPPALRAAAAMALRRNASSRPGSDDELDRAVQGALDALDRVTARLTAASLPPALGVFWHDRGMILLEAVLSLLHLRVRSRDLARVEAHLQAQSRVHQDNALELLELIAPTAYSERLSHSIGSFLHRTGVKLSGGGEDQDAADPWLARLVRCQALLQFRREDAKGELALKPEDENLLNALSVLSVLKETDLFRDVPAEYLVGLAEQCRPVNLYRDEILFREGEEGGEFYIVRSGRLALKRGGSQPRTEGPGGSLSGTVGPGGSQTRTEEPGGSLPGTVGPGGSWSGAVGPGGSQTRTEGLGGSLFGTVGPGGTVGELSVLDGRPRESTAVALEDTTLLTVLGEEWNGLLDLHPETARAMLRALSARLRNQ